MEMESPESRIIPTEDMNAIQLRISGEKFPEVILELCDNCCWLLQCISHKGILKACPVCQSKVSLIPMNIDEVCYLQHDDKRGLTIIFDRKEPLR
jgi:hypothetical protein